MGRKKIEMEPIQNDSQRRSTFNKRSVGVIKKAMELSILCNCNVTLMIHRNKVKYDEQDLYVYSNKPFEEQIKDYTSFDGEYSLYTNDHLEEMIPGKADSRECGYIIQKKRQMISNNNPALPPVPVYYNNNNNNSNQSNFRRLSPKLASLYQSLTESDSPTSEEDLIISIPPSITSSLSSTGNQTPNQNAMMLMMNNNNNNNNNNNRHNFQIQNNRPIIINQSTLNNALLTNAINNNNNNKIKNTFTIPNMNILNTNTNQLLNALSTNTIMMLPNNNNNNKLNNINNNNIQLNANSAGIVNFVPIGNSNIINRLPSLFAQNSQQKVIKIAKIDNNDHQLLSTQNNRKRKFQEISKMKQVVDVDTKKMKLN